MKIARSIKLNLESASMIDTHVFGHSSILGYYLAACTTVYQPYRVKKALITTKFRLSKRELIVPRLELIVTHMAANLASDKKCLTETKN